MLGLSAGSSGCNCTSRRRVQTQADTFTKTGTMAKKNPEHKTHASAASCSYVCVYHDALHVRECTQIL